MIKTRTIFVSFWFFVVWETAQKHAVGEPLAKRKSLHKRRQKSTANSQKACQRFMVHRAGFEPVAF